MIRLTSPRIQEFAVFTLLAVSVLWRGGKSLDAVWLLAGAASLVTLVWYARRTAEPNQTVSRLSGSVWWSGMAFVFAVIVSFVFSHTRNYGLDEVFRAGALFLVFAWVARHRYRELFALRLHHAIAILAILACFIGFFVYAFQPVDRFVGTFFDARFHTDYWPNAWAQFLLLAWPSLLIALSVSARTRLLRPAILGVLLGTLLLSYSRGALIAFSGQVVLLGIMVSCRKRLRFHPRFLLSLAATGLVALLVFTTMNGIRASRFPVQSVGEKVTFSAAEGTSSVSERRQFWRQSFTLSLEHPLTGWGPYSFRFVQPRLQTDVLATSDHPHNVFLKIAMEYGWPALALFLFFLAAIVLPPLRSALLARSSDVETERLILSLVALLGVLAHNLIDYNLQFIGIALPFWLLAGVVAPRVTQASSREGRTRKTIEVLLACGVLIAALVEGKHLVLSSLGRHAEARGDRQAAMHWYEKSSREVLSRDLHLSRALLHARDGNADLARSALDAYMRRNAEDARAWKLLGDIGEGEDSLHAYEKAFVLGRYNDLSITRGLVKTMSGAGIPIGEDRKEEIDDLVMAFADAILENAHFIALSHNVEEFIALANLLADLYPEDAPRYHIMAAQVDRHARQERETYRSRSGGNLW